MQTESLPATSAVVPHADLQAAQPSWRVTVGELQQLGLTPVLRQTADGLSGNGAGLCLSVRQLVASPAALATAADRLRTLLISGQRVTLSLLDAGACSSRRLERVLRQLQRASAAPCIDRRRLGLLVAANTVQLPGFLLMSKVLLGQGPRYVLLDDTVDGSSNNNDVWSALYQQGQRMPQLLPVYAGDIRSRCPLLNDERCAVVLEPAALLAPADSGCLVVHVNLCRFASSEGTLAIRRLLKTLRRGLGLADELLDKLHWTDLPQRRDALLNRRIAFVVSGIGDLVRLQQRDAGSITCLRELDQLITAMHQALWQESMRQARHRGVLPALLNKDPSRNLPQGGQRGRWQRRWQEALATTAVRHRHLLAMSPYALLPLDGAGSGAHFNLLPLLAHADICSFAAGGRPDHWSIKEFKDFHCRARAILMRRTASSFVATGV